MKAYEFDTSRLQKVDIDHILANGWNPKESGQGPDFRKVVKSIKLKGLRGAIVVRDHPFQDGYVEIIDGQQRWTAAKELGYKEVWIYNEGAVSDKEAKELTIWYQQQVPFDNVLEAFLVTELVDEYGPEFESPYSAKELEEFAKTSEHDFVLRGDADKVPDPPKEAITELGDLWLLGDHRLLCGDSSQYPNLVRLVDAQPMDMVWSDPPYGVDYVGKTKDALKIQNDAMSEEETERLFREVAGASALVCRAGAVWYIAAPPGPLHHLFASALKDMNIWRQTINWVKNQFVMGRSDFHYRHEPIFYGWLPGAAHYFNGDRTVDTVWEIDRPHRSADHPTMKPVALVAKALKHSSQPGDKVLDPFAGSGTTLIACQVEGRTAYCCEIDPIYADVVCKRFQQLTGIVPKRESGEEVSFL